MLNISSMKVEIISIGDELLIGQTVNTNASYLAKGLTELGLEVKRVTTVGDDAVDIRAALSPAMGKSDLVVVTGGLGPTHDDITKAVVADFFGSELILDKEYLERLKRAFERRGWKMAKVNEGQAFMPHNAQILENPVGTAPGLLFERDSKKCFVLPGVPSEMKAICEDSVFPMLHGTGEIILQKTVRTTGIPESTLFEDIGDIARIEQLAKMAFLPKASGVDIRLTVTGSDEVACKKRLEQARRLLEKKIGKYIYAYDDEALEEVVSRLLLDAGKTIAVAESCTGGLLANKLTNIPGSSNYFEYGVVTYSNQAKMDILGVPADILATRGAVSEETAIAMAESVRKISRTDFGLSTTGIAGPGGGTAEKPVGLVYIGLATARKSYARRLIFTKDRLANKERSVQAALSLLKKELS